MSYDFTPLTKYGIFIIQYCTGLHFSGSYMRHYDVTCFDVFFMRECGPIDLKFYFYLIAFSSLCAVSYNNHIMLVGCRHASVFWVHSNAVHVYQKHSMLFVLVKTILKDSYLV